jgi:hypothetical protein
MEEIKTASISVNLNDGSLSITGSEEFIERNKENIFTFVERNIRSPHKFNSETGKPEVTSSTPTKNVLQELPQNNTDIDDKYVKAGVYHIDAENGTISITETVPGGNKTEKTKNIALIVLHIRKGKIPGKDIIPICEKHNCYDSSNFSTVFKNEKTNIIRKGTGQAWTIELTHQGERAAITLLEEMSSDKK